MSGQPESLYRLQKRDIRRAAMVLTDAFQHDPIWKVVLSDATPTQKVSAFETPLLYCLKYGQVYATSENLEGIAAWLPGASATIAPWRLVWSGAMRAAMKLGWKTARKMKPIFAPLEAHRQETMRDRPFVYLQIIGVVTAVQGRGFGGRLLKTLIEECEQTGMSLYLETETEINVRMYERLGFVVVRELVLPLINLPMWEMVKNAVERIDLG